MKSSPFVWSILSGPEQFLGCCMINIFLCSDSEGDAPFLLENSQAGKDSDHDSSSGSGVGSSSTVLNSTPSKTSKEHSGRNNIDISPISKNVSCLVDLEVPNHKSSVSDVFHDSAYISQTPSAI